jgi:hypothetical protein
MEREVALVIRLVDGTLLRLEGLAREYAAVLKRDLDHWLLGSRSVEYVGGSGRLHQLTPREVIEINLDDGESGDGGLTGPAR